MGVIKVTIRYGKAWIGAKQVASGVGIAMVYRMANGAWIGQSSVSELADPSLGGTEKF
jgi:hypothetical protein